MVISAMMFPFGLQRPFTNEAFKQELKNFNVASGFEQISAPRVKAVLTDQKSVLPTPVGIGQLSGDLFCQCGDILRVVEDLNPFGMLVGFDALQSLQHLVVFDCKSALFKMQLREQGAPDRMRVQDGSDIRLAGQYRVQQCFGRRFWLTTEGRATFVIDTHKVGRFQLPLVLATGGHQQLQWITRNDDAVIAAGPNRPASRVEFTANFTKSVDR